MAAFWASAQFNEERAQGVNRKRGRLLYSSAEELVRGAGYWGEVEWYRSARLSDVSERRFLRECAWVILCSGFRERIVRQYFDYISLAFWDFESACRVYSDGGACVELAMQAFGNRRKLEAIVNIAGQIAETSFATFWRSVQESPISRLTGLPYIGAVTAYHLAKNLGLSVAKPDRHLVSLAGELGFETVQGLCGYFAKLTSEPLSIVDTVLWRATVIAGSSRALLRWIEG